jgi:uncharacterized protein with NRDE domain
MYSHKEIEDMFCLAFPSDCFGTIDVVFNNYVSNEFLARYQKETDRGSIIQYQIHYKPSIKRLVCNFVYDGFYGFFGDVKKQVRYEVSYDITRSTSLSKSYVQLSNASEYKEVEFERMW